MDQAHNFKTELEEVKKKILAIQAQHGVAERTLSTVDKRILELEGIQTTLASQIQEAKEEIGVLTARYADGDPVEKPLHRLKATLGTLETKLSTVTSALEVARTKREEPVIQKTQIEKALKHEQEVFWRLVYEIELTKTIPQVWRLLYAAKGGTCSASTLGWLGFDPVDVDFFLVRRFYDTNFGGYAETMQASLQQLQKEYGSPPGEGVKPGLFSKLLKG